jgi:hypothetical protein
MANIVTSFSEANSGPATRRAGRRRLRALAQRRVRVRRAGEEGRLQRGDCRSGHEAEPLPRAHDLDLLDHKIEPAWLSATSCEQQKPENELQSA